MKINLASFQMVFFLSPSHICTHPGEVFLIACHTRKANKKFSAQQDYHSFFNNSPLITSKLFVYIIKMSLHDF